MRCAKASATRADSWHARPSRMGVGRVGEVAARVFIRTPYLIGKKSVECESVDTMRSLRVQ
jgi:hypothetical protein